MSYSATSLRATGTEWALASLLSANLAWTLLCLGGYRPETMLWSSLLTSLTLCITIAINGFSAQRIHPASWLILPFLAYAWISVVFISPARWLGWRDWLGWYQAGAVCWIVLNGIRHPKPRALLGAVLAGLALICVVLAGYQRFLWPDWLMLGRTQLPQFVGRASGAFGIPNSLAGYLLLLIPPVIALAVQRGSSAIQRISGSYVAVTLLVGLALTISRAPWLCLLVALLIWPLCMRRKSWEWRASVFLVAAALIVVSAIAIYATVPRIKHRFDNLMAESGERSRPIMWDAGVKMFSEAPVLGSGGGSYNVLFERYRPSGFNDDPQWAHNEYLNTLVDYGLLGSALLAGAVFYLLFRVFRHRTANGPDWVLGYQASETTLGICIGLLAFILSLAFDFHLKIPALAMAFSILVAEWILRVWPAPPPAAPGPGAQIGGMTGVLICAAVALAIALPTYRGEAARYHARERIDRLSRLSDPTLATQREVLETASRLLTDACIIDEGNAQAFADRAYAQALWARVTPLRARELGKSAEADARAALALSPEIAEFWIRLGVALDLQGRWGEGGSCFGRAIQLAPANATAWYHYAYHLHLVPASRALAGAALKTSLRLDPFFRPAMILQQRLSSP